MHRQVALGAMVAVVVWLVVTAGPTFSQTSPNGQVNATVTVNVGPCLQVSTGSFTYTASEFSIAGNIRTTTSATKPTITNCSNQAERFDARGSAASSTGGANWILNNSITCPSDTDKYKHEILQSGGGSLILSTSNNTWETSVPATAGSNTRTLDTILTMPCSGSTGAGETMTMTIFLTAVIP